MKTKDRAMLKWLALVTWVIIFIIWTVTTNGGFVNTRLVPTPQKTWQTFLDILQHGYNGVLLSHQMGMSLSRLGIAVFFALITALPMGLLSGYFLPFRALVDSVVQFYRPLPPLSYYTLLILWLGIGESSKIVLLYLAAFAPLYVASASAVDTVNDTYILSARSLGASSWQVFFSVILPACLPQIFTGLRTAVGVAYTTLVAAEMVAATSGIGWMVIDASRYLKSDVMFVGIILMGITGILLDRMIVLLEKGIVFWKGKEGE